MALEDTLRELTDRRLAFKARRAQIDDELRQLRAQRLAAEQANIEQMVAKAVAEGATTGQIKRAYGTKDHRTITDIVKARTPEIEALRKAREEQVRADREWFLITDDSVRITINGHVAYFTWTTVDDEMFFSTEDPLWNDDFTIKNEAVALLDGKTETDTEEAGIIASAIRKQG